jgi:DNA-binding IclR family transcriptional regulator
MPLFEAGSNWHAQGQGVRPSLEQQGKDGLTKVPSRTVDKAIAILHQFTLDEPQLGVSELSRRLDLTKSTVHRLLASLRRGGLVEQDPSTHKYRLGREAVDLGYTAIYSDRMLATALPYLHFLSEQVGETVYLAERRGDEVATVLHVLSPTSREQMKWYDRLPLHSTSSGKILLAYTEESELAAFLQQPLPSYTEHSVTDPVALREELRLVREQGYATAFEEYQLGANAIAVPLANREGKVVAALTILGPAYTLTREKAMASLERLKAISREITIKLAALNY